MDLSKNTKKPKFFGMKYELYGEKKQKKKKNTII